MRHRRFLILIALIVFLSACGGGDNDSDSGAASDAPATSPTSDDVASATGGKLSDCPLTPEQVGSVLGQAMKREEDRKCSFVPASGKDLPTATYTAHSAVAGDVEYRKQDGYTTKVSGVGDEAYSGRESSNGISVLVRSGSDWFDVNVNTADLESDTAKGLNAAKELAKLVVSGG